MTRKSRRDRLARAALIAHSLSRLAQSRLAAAEARLAELKSAERAALQAPDLVDPTFARSRLRFLSGKRRDVEGAIVTLRAHAQELVRRARLTERLLEKADAVLRREEGIAETQRLLATSSARGKSSDLGSL